MSEEQETKRIPFDKTRALAGDECVFVMRSGNEFKAKVVFDDEEENNLLFVWFGDYWCESWCDYEGNDDEGDKLYMKPKVQTRWLPVDSESEFMKRAQQRYEKNKTHPEMLHHRIAYLEKEVKRLSDNESKMWKGCNELDKRIEHLEWTEV
jgi:hypothetical protein